MNRRWWLALVLALMIAAALGPRQGARAAGGSHLYLVFAPGLCGWEGSDRYCHDPVPAVLRAQATFSAFATAIKQAGISYQAAYYSYSPTNHAAYSVSQTHQHIGMSVQALDALLRSVSTRDTRARFDLIGYSLGGLIIVSWEATDGQTSSRAIMRRVRSVVTFDSPVRGSTALGALPIVPTFFDGAVWHDLQSGSATVRAIARHSGAWWSAHGRLHTVANTADRLVPPRDALLGSSREVTDTHCPADILFFHSCHGAVLADAADNRWVACHWLVSGSPCVSTPTLTPTPTATPTETPLPTGTATPTTTPTAVPTLTRPPGPPPTPTLYPTTYAP